MALEEAAGLVSAVDLEASAAVAELAVQAQVVEQRPDVEQFRVEAEIPVAALQGAPPVDAPGMMEDQVTGGLTDQVCGFAGQFGVGDGDPGGIVPVGGHHDLLAVMESSARSAPGPGAGTVGRSNSCRSASR